MNAVRQSGWVLGSRIAPQISGLVLLILGARFLEPAELGRFVLAFAGTEFLRRLVRAGWREALIVDPGGDAAVATTLALAAGLLAQAVTLLAALIVWQATPLGAPFALCIALMGLTLVPSGLAAVWEGLLLRQGWPDAAAKPLIAAEAVHLALGLVLLAAGGGILALAWARVARALVLALGLGRAAGWRRALAWSRARAAALLPVSGNVTASSMIDYFTSYGVDLIVGFYLGPASVAFFRIGARITGALAEVVSETVRILAWTTLPARARATAADPAGIRRSIDAFFDTTVVLVAPLYVGLALVAEPLVQLLLGATWQPAAQVIAVLALARLCSLPGLIATPSLALVGKTRYVPRLAVVIAATALGGMLITGSWGLQAIAWSQALAAALSGIAVVVLLSRAVLERAPLTLRPDTLAGLALMAAAVLGVRHIAGAAAAGPAMALGLQVLAGTAAWLGFLRWRRRRLWDSLAAGFRQREASE